MPFQLKREQVLARLCVRYSTSLNTEVLYLRVVIFKNSFAAKSQKCINGAYDFCSGTDLQIWALGTDAYRSPLAPILTVELILKNKKKR